MRKTVLRSLLNGVIPILILVLYANAQVQTDIPGPLGSGFFGETVTALPNGNFVVSDTKYDLTGPVADVGAVHLYSAGGTLISSLTGSSPNDRVGAFGIRILSNGDYVVISPYWSNGLANEVGAATLCNAATGCPGIVSNANSLVGTSALDHVGVGGVMALPGGKYVVNSYGWNGGMGAVTFCQSTGCSGDLTVANSLHGTDTSDEVGFYQVIVLQNGNYVVGSIYYDMLDNGAVTLCDGSTGCVGTVPANNSLIGSNFFDSIGSQGIVALSGGDYVVGSANWNSYRGAVTRCSQTTGCPPAISAANSLIGGASNTRVSDGGIFALNDGNYVVSSFSWNGGRGAVTWCSGTGSCTGSVLTTNSLTGTATTNGVGGGGVQSLPGGKYLAISPNWDGGPADIGAVTFCGAAGVCNNTTISAANSLIGSTANDLVGGDTLTGRITVLADGDYVVGSSKWDNGAIVDAGAATFCNGTTGCTGVVSIANSLYGTTANDNVGMGGSALTNGNYVVRSPNWDGASSNVGAATFCNGTTGCVGAVSAANSLIGSVANDGVSLGGISANGDGSYIVYSQNWDNGATVNAGAMTYGGGNVGALGTVTSLNSVLGNVANGGSSMNRWFDTANARILVGRPAENIVTILSLAPTAAGVTVAGRVHANGRGINGVRITLTASDGSAFVTQTNAFGYFSFADVEAGPTYLVEASSKRYQFAAQALTVSDNIEDLEISPL